MEFTITQYTKDDGHAPFDEEGNFMKALPTRIVKAAIRAAKERWVSQVATSSGGFGPAYIKAGSMDKLSDSWKSKRKAFISRHMAQVEMNDEALWIEKRGEKEPSRRHLALAVWAYSPTPARLEKWLANEGYL